MHLTALNVHPLKSAAPRPLTEAEVLPRGLAEDRSWMIVDAEGTMVSAREVHETFRVVADTPATAPDVAADLRLRAAGHPDLLLSAPTGAAVPVRLLSQHLRAVPAGDAADAWLGEVLGRRDVRLVWCNEPTGRNLQPGFSEPGDHTAFADAFPVTIASEASLAQLNTWIAEAALERGGALPEPLPMRRFRPNLVVDGDAPFAEDDWREIVVGDVGFRVAKPVGRCVMTTIDTRTLATGKEPIRTLSQRRRVGSSTLFALHLVPLGTGTVRVGDPVSGS